MLVHGELRVSMGVIRAESDMNIAEMSNFSSFLEEICLECQKNNRELSLTAQTVPSPPKTWLRYVRAAQRFREVCLRYSDRSSQSLSTQSSP
jgi:hypothetical protein